MYDYFCEIQNTSIWQCNSHHVLLLSTCPPLLFLTCSLSHPNSIRLSAIFGSTLGMEARSSVTHGEASLHGLTWGCRINTLMNIHGRVFNTRRSAHRDEPTHPYLDGTYKWFLINKSSLIFRNFFRPPTACQCSKNGCEPGNSRNNSFFLYNSIHHKDSTGARKVVTERIPTKSGV